MSRSVKLLLTGPWMLSMGHNLQPGAQRKGEKSDKRNRGGSRKAVLNFYKCIIILDAFLYLIIQTIRS